MNWIVKRFGASIGKKLLMAVTGSSFCGFLIVHLAGNVTLFQGKEAFNAYAQQLHSLGFLLTLAEWGLLFFAGVHISTGMWLFWQNYRARPVSYAVKKMKKDRL